MPELSLEPTRTLLRLQEALDRLHHNPSLGLTSFGAPGLTVYPPLNVFSDGESLVVRAEVPGFGHDQLEVTLESRRLTVSGERRPEESEERCSYHRRERQSGKFSRTLQLPDELDTERAEAQCRDGVLTIRIPKRAELQPKTVAITQG